MFIFINIYEYIFWRSLQANKWHLTVTGCYTYFPLGKFGFILAIQLKETRSETICGYNMVEVQVQKQYLF